MDEAAQRKFVADNMDSDLQFVMQTQVFLLGRAQTASIVSAWETARKMIAKEIEIRAEDPWPRILQTHERGYVTCCGDSIWFHARE